MYVATCNNNETSSPKLINFVFSSRKDRDKPFAKMKSLEKLYVTCINKPVEPPVMGNSIFCGTKTIDVSKAKMYSIRKHFNKYFIMPGFKKRQNKTNYTRNT